MNFIVIISIRLINSFNKYLLPNNIIVYSNNNTINIFTTLITSFKDIFIDIEKTINIFKK